ncbi:hypothetical protein D9619_003983 [Psilocybe cf. subviscida]|uniref:Uncharacterized protein n=1 Tax=Psilocybe cf. subviscida TaxID=2480587 RepID=A0A8H5BRH2_9AGAR|nr:hypothetical protein D9619_003983 [Psilocybe cf. subviscida]
MLLRARSKTGGTRERVSRPSPIPRYQHQDDPFRHMGSRHPRDAASRREGLRLTLSLSRVIRSLLFLAISLCAVRVYIRHFSRTGRGVLDPATATPSPGARSLDQEPGINASTGFAPYLGKEEGASAEQAGAKQLKTDKQRWRFPLVDRTILRKLERMRKFFAPGYYDLAPASPPLPGRRARWPPLVTRIPDAPPRAPFQRSHVAHQRGMADTALCASTAHPRACRFLLPLRIAEQESKARIHLTQVARLARELNRTLVLPQVGKSKIGACFKWELSSYYDVASLGISARPGAEMGPDVGSVKDGVGTGDFEWFVELDDFHDWLAERTAGIVADQPSSQLVSVGPALPPGVPFRRDLVYSNEDVSVYGYGEFGAWERDLPGCFPSKFRALALETMPVFMSAPIPVGKDGSIKSIGNSVLEAFAAVSAPVRALAAGVDDTQAPIGSASHPASGSPSGLDGSSPSLSPEVLVVNWDLRQPIFGDPLSIGKGLQYSPYMHEIADRYAPSSDFLVVQWRMETVDPNLLDACAHSLVDVLHGILHDPALSSNITTVWFASDYPRSVVKNRKFHQHLGTVAKSGTFKDFDTRHEVAVDILRVAFEDGGDLSAWRLTDLIEAAEEDGEEDEEFLKDSGALGIVDKLVSINANVFVSGSSRCSRRSSFTKQVVDGRKERMIQSGTSRLQNTVDVFG